MLRAVIAKVLRDNGLRHAAAERFNDTIVEQRNQHGDVIVNGWNDALSGDFATLARAVDELDVRDLHTADTTALRRTNRLNIWADASTAFDRVEQAATTCRAVLTAMHVPLPREHDPIILAVDADAPTIDAARAADRGVNVWDLARAGATPRLATISAFIEAVGRLTAERQQHAAAGTR